MIEVFVLKKVMPWLFAGALLFACQDKTMVKLETFRAGGGWGYQLKKNDQIFIRQEYIPAVAGNQAFISKSDAEKTGLLVLKKLKQKQHPAISVHELDSLQISYSY